jgi:hypothetical protein
LLFDSFGSFDMFAQSRNRTANAKYNSLSLAWVVGCDCCDLSMIENNAAVVVVGVVL